MPKALKQAIIMLLVATMLLTFLGSTAIAANDFESEDDVGAGAMTVDFALVRPLGFITTIIGSVLFGFSFPFSVIGGNSMDVFQKMVVEPAKFTFARPLGIF